MKLLFCKDCHSIFNLSFSNKKCQCGNSGGRYLNNLEAEYWGDCIPLGFANGSFAEALYRQPLSGMGKEFTAFVIPEQCQTFKKKVQ